MIKNDHSLYAAYKAKDARFDGRFFIGISTTGIYCRPVCRARQAKMENCTFYHTAAEAEKAGYRPCLLCRPELAPGNAVTDAIATLARRAARMLEDHAASSQNLDELAGQLGCTGRHLRRVFMAEYHVSPVFYRQTCRLLLAKNLLTDTNLSILDVAMTAGFGSLRRFNDLFKRQYALSPTALRKQIPLPQKPDGVITLALGYRSPYRFDAMLRFLDGRAIPGVEVVRDGSYRRTVRLTDAKGTPIHGWLRVGHQPAKHVLTITMSHALLPALSHVLARIRHLFDLCCDPATIDQTLASMNEIRPGLWVLGTRVPGSFDPFETAVRAVLGQQITVKAARTLAARITAAYGMPLQTGLDGLTHLFPSPADLLALGEPLENHLGPLGIPAARARTICELAKAFANWQIHFDAGAQPEVEIKKLLALPGIGNWTAQYIAMRTMGWPDAFLETDAGIAKALAPHTPKERLKMAEAWRPWRSYATVNLWSTL